MRTHRTHRTRGEREERAHIWKHRGMYATFRDVPCFIQIQEQLSSQLCLTAGNSQREKRKKMLEMTVNMEKH